MVARRKIDNEKSMLNNEVFAIVTGYLHLPNIYAPLVTSQATVWNGNRKPHLKPPFSCLIDKSRDNIENRLEEFESDFLYNLRRQVSPPKFIPSLDLSSRCSNWS